jgi:hypothetical protein
MSRIRHLVLLVSVATLLWPEATFSSAMGGEPSTAFRAQTQRTIEMRRARRQRSNGDGGHRFDISSSWTSSQGHVPTTAKEGEEEATGISDAATAMIVGVVRNHALSREGARLGKVPLGVWDPDRTTSHWAGRRSGTAETTGHAHQVASADKYWGHPTP